MRRALPVLSLALAGALVLAGCAGDPEAAPTDVASENPTDLIDVCDAPSGASVESVEVSGDFGVEPAVTIPAPLVVDATERTVLIEGGEVDPGALVLVAYQFYNAATGAAIDGLGSWGTGATPEYLRGSYDFVSPGFAQTIGCLGVGSRVVGVVPADEGFADLNEQFGLGVDDAVVFVADIVGDTTWTDDIPEVGGSAEAPTVTLPDTAPPADLRINVLEEGDGATVGPADSVTVHYLGTSWETGEIFDQSYTRGAPSTFPVQGVVQGFMQALVGQKVGSRVLVSMPPALGYGDAATSQHELAGQTLVFLIDITATAAG